MSSKYAKDYLIVMGNLFLFELTKYPECIHMLVYPTLVSSITRRKHALNARRTMEHTLIHAFACILPAITGTYKTLAQFSVASESKSFVRNIGSTALICSHMWMSSWRVYLNCCDF